MRQINLTNTQQHYNTCQNKVLMGSATQQFNKYTSKLRSDAHKSMYLETDHPRLLCKPLEEKCILGKSLELLLCRTLSVIETCDANLVSTLLSIAAPQAIFLSVMNCLTIIWCRPNDFCLRKSR